MIDVPNDAGVITVENSPADRRVRRLSLSEPGLKSFDIYLQQHEDLVRSARGQDEEPWLNAMSLRTIGLRHRRHTTQQYRPHRGHIPWTGYRWSQR